MNLLDYTLLNQLFSMMLVFPKLTKMSIFFPIQKAYVSFYTVENVQSIPVFIQCEHIIVADVIFMGFVYPPFDFLFINKLSYILVHKLSLCTIEKNSIDKIFL